MVKNKIGPFQKPDTILSGFQMYPELLVKSSYLKQIECNFLKNLHLNKKINSPSEYLASLVFKWLICVLKSNALVFKWLLKTEQICLVIE